MAPYGQIISKQSHEHPYVIVHDFISQMLFQFIKPRKHGKPGITKHCHNKHRPVEQALSHPEISVRHKLVQFPAFN